MSISKHDALTNAIHNDVQNLLSIKKITPDKEFLEVLAHYPFITVLASDAISGKNL
jgi:hypothetical protein